MLDLALVASVAALRLTEAALLGLAPLIALIAATVSAGALGHLLVWLLHGRSSEALLSEGLSLRAAWRSTCLLSVVASESGVKILL